MKHRRRCLMRAVVVLIATLATVPVMAQPTPAAPACDACVRGDQLIDQFGLQPLRDFGSWLPSLELADPLTPEQYARIVTLRQRHAALSRLGALEDEDHQAIAAALCSAPPTTACATATAHALRCFADRCAVDLPADVTRLDAAELPPACTKYATRKKSSAFGVGFDWGTGWQRSQWPTDGRAWSLGIESRLRLGRRLGTVARVDRIAGRDEGNDADGDGIDDSSTGSITRISALAGPSFILDQTRFENTRRFVRLDLLAGYVSTRSQPDESGVAVGADLAFQISIFRIGARFVQGLGGASDASMLLGHLGFVAGSPPPDARGADCEAEQKRSSRIALAYELPLGGYGISEALGYLATGISLEAMVYLSRRFDAVAHADLLLFPGDERDRVIHQAVLGGLRIDHGSKTGRRSRTGLFSTVLGGYTHGAGLTPSTTGTGPVVDLGLGWGLQSREGAAYFRLHGRFGLSSDNEEYRAIFLTGGLEFRLDPDRWRDRL